jgi:heterodisulfide reductase subunit C
MEGSIERTKPNMISLELTKQSQRLSTEIQKLTGENVDLCYQCKKCTLGCPTAYEMALKPHEMMRALQFGAESEVFESGMIWMCLSCETCNTRCPQDIDILRVIDGLRELSMSGRVAYYNPHPEIPSLHRYFLRLVKRFGRIDELRLAIVMNLKMVDPFKDIDLALPLLMKRKLGHRTEKSGGVEELRRVVSRIREIEGGP